MFTKLSKLSLNYHRLEMQKFLNFVLRIYQLG